MDEKKVREAIYCMKESIGETMCEECVNYYKCDCTKMDDMMRTAIEALEKQLPKKPICVPKPYSEELGFNDEIHRPSCSEYVGYITEGMSEPEQMEYCCDCGQRIAKDWSE